MLEAGVPFSVVVTIIGLERVYNGTDVEVLRSPQLIFLYFVDHDAAVTVVVVAALTNILGEIPCQLGGKSHAPLYKTLRTFYAGFS
jgi:hypothetical protein